MACIAPWTVRRRLAASPTGRLIVSVFAVAVLAALMATPASAFQFLGKWGTTGPGQLNQPFDLAVNPQTGNQYVADQGNHRIVQFGPDGGFVRTWGSLGAGDTQFNGPFGIGLDRQGNVWVADELNNRIKKFDSAGAPLAVLGTSGVNPGELSGPDDVAVDASGNYYVAEQSMNRVQKFAPNGGFLNAWSVGSGPTGVAVGGSTVYVVNYNSATGARFDLDGNPLGAFGAPGTGAGEFNQPWHVGVGPDGRVYVADRANDRVQRLDAGAGFLDAFGWGVATGAAKFEICATSCQAGIIGSGDGQFASPGGVGVDCRGNVYVVEQGFGRVQKLGEPGTPNPPCPSNEFSFGKVKKNKRKGTATLLVTVPDPGKLVLTGKGLKKQRRQVRAGAIGGTVAAKGGVKLVVKTKRGKKRRRLNRAGKVGVKAKVTYTPTGGDPNTKAIRIKLITRR